MIKLVVSRVYQRSVFFGLIYPWKRKRYMIRRLASYRSCGEAPSRNDYNKTHMEMKMPIKVDKYGSLKMSLISFLAMCAVVSWHIAIGSRVLKRWLAPIFTVWSVPWFFFVSGVFFVYSIQKVSWGRFVIGKVRSLLIPYVAWCVLGVAILTLMGQDIPLDPSAVFALDRLHPVGDHPMWYIRSLMGIFTIALPVWCLSDRVLESGWVQRSVFAGGLMITSIVLQKLLGVDLHFGPGSSLYYFLIGVVFSEKVVRFPMLPGLNARKRLYLGLTALLVAMFIRGIWFAMGYDYFKMGGTLVANVSVLVFMFALLALMDFKPVIDFGWRILGRFVKYSSFVYMVHWIFLGSLVDLVRKLGVPPDVVYIGSSFIVPFLFCFLGAILRRCIPNVYFVLTGNRG